MPPRTRHLELSPRVFQILLWEAEFREQSHISSSDGTLKGFWYLRACTLQKGKLRLLRGESVAVWRPNQGPLFGTLPNAAA